MCGKNTRWFMGEKPKALIFTGCVINIPATIFNAVIAPVGLWGDNRYIILSIGVFLQILCNVLMLYTSIIDPGILPATFVSKEAKETVDKKYINIRHKG